MAQLHMSEAELARDLHSVLAKVRQGVEVVVESEHRPVAVLRPADPPRRTISECIAIAEQRERERGYAVTLDPGFAADVEEIVNDRKPWALVEQIAGHGSRERFLAALDKVAASEPVREDRL